MERTHRPPPLNLTPPSSARNSTRSSSSHSKSNSQTSTLSRIAESLSLHQAKDSNHHNKKSSRSTWTPVAAMMRVSVFETDDDWNTSRPATVARLAADFCHILVAMLLAIIMAFYLNYYAAPRLAMGSTAPQAVFLVVLLGLDVLLDFRSIGWHDKKWAGWALAARLALGVAYLAVFTTYAAVGGAFPGAYTYWGMSQRFATPVAYLFIWILVVWNFGYVVICRHRFASEARRYSRKAKRFAAARKQRHDNMVHVDVEEGFKEMSDIIDKERSLSVSTMATLGMAAPKPAVIKS